MDTNSLAIVCYTGGTCGDLISAMIDYHDATFTVFKTVKHADRRQRLKKPHLFTTTEEKNQYLVEVAQQYNSIPSHDLDYHVQQQHKFISIIVEDATVAQWAANRFKQLHRPHVWEDMSRQCGASTVDEYAQMLIDYSNMVKKHTDRIISLESIKNGQGIDALEQVYGPISQQGKNIYKNWYNLQCSL